MDMTALTHAVKQRPFTAKPEWITPDMEASIGAEMVKAARGQGGHIRFQHNKSHKRGFSEKQIRLLSLLTNEPQRTVDLAAKSDMTCCTAGYTLSTLRNAGKAERHPLSNRSNVYWVKA